jgi:4-hydroxy-2-oxoheptanedioate aldolase
VDTSVRLNGLIKAWESGRIAVMRFMTAVPENGFTAADSPYDAIMFDMEHQPFDPGDLRATLQAMLDRRRIAERGTVAPAVTPLVRIPANGREMSQWMVKQVLDSGVYGIMYPHIATVEDARNAVASARYSRPVGAPHFEPRGARGDGPGFAARYWGLAQQEYYQRADLWPLVPEGELTVIIQCESMDGVRNLDSILSQVPGIAAVLIGEGDLSQDLGHPRQYEHPSVVSAMQEVVDVCRDHDVICGHPHVTPQNVDRLVEQGYRLMAIEPVAGYAAIDTARAAGARD